jgi:glycosyltransferase involved in cell wall biosynthesis
MKITIVTISYNQAQFLPRCIESIITQSGVLLEYIIVDPGSNDSSRKIIDSYGDKIIKVYKSDSGPSEGLNNGFSIATGNIYGFINSDDYLLPGALEYVVNFFKQSNKDVFLSGSGYIEGLSKNKIIIHPTRMTTLNLLYRASTIFQQGTFFTADMYKNVHGFNSDNKTCWDYEFFLLLTLNGYRNEITNKKVAVFVVHLDSITGSGRKNISYDNDINEIFMRISGHKFNLLDSFIRSFLRVLKLLKNWFNQFNRFNFIIKL